ncbi:MAG: transglycosylase domain-containing protein [Bacteroidales bacterium]|nr:transglycosylase domain-containing protein [Bacteroidales bacterium]MBQ2198473.1 transglycosylase domain-containing protein [Bacteroidales bacterium]MBQ2531037.1 transglycosylase domain-containing protein [Bacteroidales bacterium]MCR5133220.1 transglycosylase domain-containing protein [Bacteroidales bacterium]MEE3475790.1 transglycosylase domain-containing protein [Candidatus Cryptobacteroides sp.]
MTEETQKKISKWFWRIITFPVLLLIFMILLVWAFADIPSFKELENPESKLATQIIAEGGEVLTTFHIENRTYVTYEELSPNVVHAAIATEDARFYRHSGIDFKGLARVLFKTILMRNSSQGGGSTITQQLAKTLYPRSEAHSKIPGAYQVKMVWIKLKEWITAVKLEKNYTKDEIMTMYLNSIFFGSNAYGIRSASETFFGKQPSELTIEEAATLIGMANKPTRYNPALNPDKSLARRNFVIGQMEKAGYIDKHQRDSIREIPIELSYQVLDHNAGRAPYFRDMIRRVMTAKKPHRSDYNQREDFTVDSLAWANSELFGWIEKNRKADGSQYDLDRDGLRIYTTINYKMQQYAEEAVAERIKALQKDFDRELRYKRNPPFANDIDQPTREKLMNQARKWSDRWRMLKKSGLTEAQILKTFSEPEKMRVFAYNNKGYIDTTMTPDDSIRYYKSLLRTSFVAMEPGTGRVKAYVGGPNYRYFKYDNVRQGKRQVGSTIKPFLYTLAMQEGMNPCTQVVNLPQTFVTPSGTWTPRSTDSERWIGATVSLKWGITNSSNNISAYLMKQFGPHAMVAMMRRMGIMSHVDAVPALCVGPADIALWDMVAAYNTFPSKGVFIEPLFVTRIEDSQGNVLSEFSNRKTEAISDATAYLMVNLMKGVVEEGTAQRLRSRYNLTGEMAGKTGTTNDNSDGWFIGYTPTIVAGCWTGCEDRQVHFQSTALGQGANASLPTWAIFMKKVWADGTLGVTRDDKFSAPAGMEGSDGCEGGGDGGASVSVAQERIEDYYFE